MAEYRCDQCDQTEFKCKCDKYCSFCLGYHDVRLCEDGHYYCLACRESCDFHAQMGIN